MPTPEPEIIGVAPKFTKLLADILIPEGETTRLECAVEGEPIPKITWLLNNHEVPPCDRLEVIIINITAIESFVRKHKF